MKQLKLILILQILFFISSCFPKWDKTIPDPILPPETQEGKGTFACKINGKVYVDDRIQEAKFASYDAIVTPSVMSFGGLFSEKINGKTSKRTILIFLGIEKGQKLNSNTTYKIFNFIDFGKNPFKSYSAYIDENSCNFYSDSLLNGYVTITKLDTIKQFVSGKFNMSFKNGDCHSYYKNDTIKITEGIFDVNYTY